jgi:nucleoside phosphorylase
VVTSKDFVKWIRDGDRSCLAVEMEAAGLMIAAHMGVKDRAAAFVIRGISDLADDRKAKLDQLGAGAFRKLAMQNAASYLWTLIEAGLLPRRPEST